MKSRQGPGPSITGKIAALLLLFCGLSIPASAQFDNSAQGQLRQQQWNEQLRQGYELSQQQQQQQQQQQDNQQQPNSSPPLRYSPPPPRDRYAAFAAPAAGGEMFTSSNYASLSEAKAAVLESCRRAGYADCQITGSFGNACGTSAFSKFGGPNTPGYGATLEAAVGAAMDNCNRASPRGLCSIGFIPICIGPGRPPISDEKTPEADIERWSARFDKREYWGILAQSPQTNALFFGTDYPSVAVAEKDIFTHEPCPGCKTIEQFRNICAGFAWNERNRAKVYHFLNLDPIAVRRQASAACASGEGGMCLSMVRCSGRAYKSGYPGQDDAASVLKS